MKLDDWLTAQKLANDAFARRIGVHPISVSKYRQGRMMPRPALMDRIAKETGGAVQPNDFFSPQAVA